MSFYTQLTLFIIETVSFRIRLLIFHNNLKLIKLNIFTKAEI